MTQISVIILTFNEERNLPTLLDSLGKLPLQMWVVDSGSTDRTLDIATAGGASVVHHPFEGHSRQWNWALASLPIKTDWVLALDSDQRLTPELCVEITLVLQQPLDVNGFFINRRQIFLGRWIKHGGYYPKYLLKLFRREAVSVDEDDLVDHHFNVRGPVRKLRHDIVEDNHNEHDLLFWMQKHIRYASLQAKQEFTAERSSVEWGGLRGGPDERVAFLKSIWMKLPLYVRPVLYLGYRYILRLGFLDRREGIIFHFFQGFWYRLLVDIRLGEMKS